MDSERVAILEKLVAMDPQDLFSKFALGLEHKADMPHAAIRHFEQLLAVNADYVPAYFQMGLTYLEQNEFESARAWLEQGVAVAERVGDHHALGEMQEVLETL